VFIEEAAGISKYKERRRETETRMRHTRENLERLNDLRDELGQTAAAPAAPGGRRQKSTRNSSAKNGADAPAACWRRRSGATCEEQRSRTGSATVVGDHEVRLEAVHAEQQAVDTRLEEQRVTHRASARDALGCGPGAATMPSAPRSAASSRNSAHQA
jgi:chromosome segregation protein